MRTDFHPSRWEQIKIEDEDEQMPEVVMAFVEKNGADFWSAPFGSWSLLACWQ